MSEVHEYSVFVAECSECTWESSKQHTLFEDAKKDLDAHMLKHEWKIKLDEIIEQAGGREDFLRKLAVELDGEATEEEGLSGRYRKIVSFPVSDWFTDMSAVGL